MRLIPLALVAALAVPALAAAQEADTAGEEVMLAEINALRAEQQLAPVARLAELDAVARAHTEEMASNAALAHVSSTSGTPEDRVRNAGIPSGAVTENVAMHADAAQAHAALLASAPHRANMLRPEITHVGLSAIRADNAVYVTQLFAERPAEAPEAPAPSITAPIEAPAAALAEAAAPAFGLIPPFVEQAVGADAAQLPQAAAQLPQAAAQLPQAAAQLPQAATQALDAAAPEADAAPQPPSASDATADAPASAAPTASSGASSGASNDAAAPAAGNADALQQLVGIGQALLRAVTQPAAQ